MRILLLTIVLALGAGACSKNKKPAPAPAAAEPAPAQAAPPTGGAADDATSTESAAPDSADPCEGGEQK
jgi:hypothetical protein